MTELQIIKETARYYSKDTSRRGVIKCNGAVSCLYKSPEKKMCAVGRALNWNICKTLGVDNINSTGDVNGLDNEFPDYGVEDLLKEKYKGHDLGFWSNLQDFHDTERYWDEKGLTKEGEYQLEKLKELYK